MAHSKRDIKAGRARTKVAGDDEMLRTGFFDGTPLEGGKIADSHPVDLFAAARRVADADTNPSSQQQQQQRQQQEEQDGGTATKNVVTAAESAEPPANPAATATTEQQPGRRQGMAEPTAGGRRLGVGRPAY